MISRKRNVATNIHKHYFIKLEKVRNEKELHAMRRVVQYYLKRLKKINKNKNDKNHPILNI